MVKNKTKQTYKTSTPISHPDDKTSKKAQSLHFRHSHRSMMVSDCPNITSKVSYLS